MIKKLAPCSVLVFLLLASCTSKKYQAKYYKYSCPQLYYKYQSLKEELRQEQINMVAIRAVSVIEGFLEQKQNSQLSQLNRQNSYLSSSKARKYKYEAKIKAIEDTAIEKRCENVKF